MPGPFLYSTNPFLKLLIQERFRGDEHYVWCAENFDGKKLPGYTVAALIGATSNPAEIYRKLKEECDSSDRHSSRIADWTLSLKALAITWEGAGTITSAQKQDIVFLVENASFQQWRPLVYVISRPLVAARLQAVPAAKCASFGPEFTILDLKRAEFDVIEL